MALNYTDIGARTTTDIGAFQSEGSSTRTYSKGSVITLPTDTSDLTEFTAQEYINVDTQDAITTSQESANISVFLFKVKNDGNNDLVTFTWYGKSDNTSTVYMQVYNTNSSTWTTVDSNVPVADAFFELQAQVTTSEYSDVDNFISCRVYQELT